MTHRFPIKEIAAQAGLGPATIDRVLNGRANVSAQSKARVMAALAELEAQERQLSARGRRFFFDMVIEAPTRFVREIRRATEQVLPRFAPLNLRARFECHETMSEQDVSAILARIAKRGSNGVCLKARDVQSVRKGIAALRDKGIPVVTLVTDVPNTPRLAYSGLDNAQAGRTAAHIIKRELQGGTVLCTISNRSFEGEDARWGAFSEALRDSFDLVLIRDAAGLNIDTSRAVEQALVNRARLDAVYSMSGGNRAIASTLRHLDLEPRVFVAHDLDSDNIGLLQNGVVSHVLHHDLETDMAQVFRQLCAFHRAMPAPKPSHRSDVQIVMAPNIPNRYLK